MAVLLLGLAAPALAATRPMSVALVTMSGTAMDSKGDLLAGWRVVFGPRDSPADQVTATVAANGTYAMSVPDQASALAIFAPGSSYGNEHDAVEVQSFTPPASGLFNPIVWMVTASVHVEDLSGHPVAGATITAPGTSSLVTPPLISSGFTGLGWQTPIALTTDTAGNATFHLLQSGGPTFPGTSESLAISPPSGSGLAPASLDVSLNGDSGDSIALVYTTTTVLPGSGLVAAPTSGSADLAMDLTLNQPSAATVTVAWNTLYVPGVAPNPFLGPEAPARDYTASSGTVSFAPGTTRATVHIPVLADSNPTSPDEFFIVSFHNPTNANLGGFWGLGFGVITPAP